MENKIVIMASKKFGTIRKICEGGKFLYCGSDVAKALGYSNSRKALSDHCKGVTFRYTLTNGGKQELSFIPEADVYRLICHSKLPSAMEFEKWVFEDVVPKAVNDNLNPEPEQLTLETSEYHYFPKTLNGEPVITLADFEHFTGINGFSARHTLYKYCKSGVDFRLLEGAELAAFKAENRLISKLISTIIIITKSGVEKLLRYFNCNAEMPLAIEEKKEEKSKRLGSMFVTEKVKKQLAAIREEAEAIKQLTYLLDAPAGTHMISDQRDIYADVLKRRMRGMANSTFNLNLTLELATNYAPKEQA